MGRMNAGGAIFAAPNIPHLSASGCLFGMGGFRLCMFHGKDCTFARSLMTSVDKA